MELTHELKIHVRDAKITFNRIWEFRFPKWLVALFVALALVAGWAGGLYRGFTDGYEFSELFVTSMLDLAAQSHANGNSYIAEEFHAKYVDRFVANFVTLADKTLREKIWRMASPTYWTSKKYEQQEHKQAVEMAERRLRLVPTARPETIEELRKLKMQDYVIIETGYFEQKAQHYSKLLGREIRAEQLLPDAWLRERIDNNKKNALTKP